MDFSSLKNKSKNFLNLEFLKILNFLIKHKCLYIITDFFQISPLLVPDVDNFSNANYIKLEIFLSNFKQRFHRGLNPDLKIDLI